MAKRSIFLLSFLLGILCPSLAQVSDDFSDGDFTSNPTWSGTEGLFLVENGQLRSNSSGEAEYYLSTPNDQLNGTQWEFFINLDFSTSGANFVDIYLVADDLTDIQNGYFLRFGGTDDEISFFKRSNGSQELLIDGTDDVVGSSGNNIFFTRVTRSASGEWTVEYDPDNTGVFEPGGSVTDNEIASTSHFGIFIEQSSAASPVNSHYFDDFSIGPIPVDESAPEILSVEPLSPTEALLVFTEVLDEATAEMAANYDIGGGFLSIDAAELMNPNEVILTVTPDFQNGNSYILFVNGVEDLSGNATVDESIEFTYFQPDEAGFKDVVFNELICDEDDVPLFEDFGPVLGIPSFTALSNSGDSLTLLNPDDEIIDLVSYTDNWYSDPEKDDGGWSLELINPETECSGQPNWSASNSPDGGTPGAENSIFDNTPDTQAPEIASFSVLTPQQVQLVFTELMDETSLLNGNYTWNQDITTNQVSPSADLLSVTITTDQPLETGTGYTLSISEITDCVGNEIDAGTEITILTGEQPLPGDLIINEIMADPTPVVELSEAEYFELFNRSDKVIEIQGISLNSNEFTQSRIIQPGSYLLCADSDLESLFADFPEAYPIDGLGTSFFANSGDSLALSNMSGELVDQVVYTDDWYNDPDHDDGGYSLERINPFTDCSDMGNWAASTDDSGGTPGQQNAVFDDSPDTSAPTVISSSVSEGDQVEIVFSEPMDESSLLDGSYTWDQGIETTNISATFDLKSAVLVLDQPLEVGTEYTLTINDLTDCEGNELASNTELSILLGIAPRVYDLLITEIMADPTPGQGLPEGEYFELYNAGDSALQIQGIRLNDKEFTTPRILLPGEYLLCIDDGLQADFLVYPDAYLIEGLGSSFFTNGGRELNLFNPEGERIDRVAYTEAWYGDSERSDGGYSLERINLEEPCRAMANWRASQAENGGTPGAQNSVFSTDPDLVPPVAQTIFVQNATELRLVFNEPLDTLSALMADLSTDPALGIESINNRAPGYTDLLIGLIEPMDTGLIYTLTISGLSDCSGNILQEPEQIQFAIPENAQPGDILINEVLFNPNTGGADFVEIYNNSDKNIGLQSWLLQDEDFDTETITENALVIFPGAYKVLTSNPANIAQEYPFGQPETYVNLEATPSFNNDAGTVIIADSTETIIDRFDYLEDYHFSLLNSFKGVSLERLSFTRPTNDGGNWTSAAEKVGFATPGYQNSQYNPEGTARSDFELDEDVFSPDNDGFQDVLKINYKLAQSGNVASVRIFDRRGRLVRQLENNTLLGTEGTLSWDGLTDQGDKARIGAYLVFINLYRLDGGIEEFKLPCVVAGRLGN
jgi:hypothetical protein